MNTILNVAPVEHPVISVLMVLYRGGRDALAAISALIEHTSIPFEVIVVDNASPDASGALVRISTTGTTFVANPTNRGFGQAMNQAAELARGDVLCLLNPDVEVGSDWTSALLDRLDNDGIGAVSPVLLNPDGSIQEAGATVDRDGWTHQCTDASNTAPHRVDYASAACLLVRAKAFRDVGGFDPRYELAYFEDVDLAFAMSAAGWDTWLEPAVRVQHTGAVTDVAGASRRLSDQNHMRFVDKWRDHLARLQPTMAR
ncbi:hypothetical protein BH10ACT2_BH10ACT2_00260 [soil metagenome]